MDPSEIRWTQMYQGGLMDDVANPKIIRLPGVLSRIGIKRSTLYQMIESGDFPKQIKLGERSVGWLETEINLWIKTRIDKSRGGL
jgi:prophage regulatory protein